MIAPEFLDLEEVLEIHALQLDEFGGIAGVRDRDCSNRLSSSRVQPHLESCCMPICSRWPLPTSFIS